MEIIFTFLVNLIGGAFAELLSFHTEKITTGAERPSPEGSMLKIAARSAVEELKGMGFILAIWLLLLLLNFIPMVGFILFFICSGIWTAVSLAFEFIAPTAERRGMRFVQKRKLIFNNFFSAIGFGGGIMILTFIPVINFFFLPFAIIGGTMWFIGREKPVSDT